MRLILASGSPRRRELLATAGVPFEVIVSSIEEIPADGETPQDYVRRLATEKAMAVAAAEPDAWVIGADTVVWLDGHLLEKPADREHAISMLESIGGREHTVFTGVTLHRIEPRWLETTVTESRVRIADLPRRDIEWYVETGEPMDKAGAYAVQGIGGWFIESIHGSYTNVVGLPLSTLFAMMVRAGIDPLRPVLPER